MDKQQQEEEEEDNTSLLSSNTSLIHGQPILYSAPKFQQLLGGLQHGMPFLEALHPAMAVVSPIAPILVVWGEFSEWPYSQQHFREGRLCFYDISDSSLRLLYQIKLDEYSISRDTVMSPVNAIAFHPTNPHIVAMAAGTVTQSQPCHLYTNN